jgi:hypothetical protein|tara:strand:+ start:207 stop:395 length:189 start_codon:yes stop_codon:yes gene_type:complete
MSKVSEEIGWMVVNFFNLIATAAWVAGMVIAQGFVSTAFALVMPLWAWYLLAERLLQVYGVI